MSRALDKFQGQYGFSVGSTGTAAPGYWAIQMLTDTTFSAISGKYDGTLTGVTIGSGNIIYGEFNSYTAGTGTVIGYIAG
jgi:hypothetical protein